MNKINFIIEAFPDPEWINSVSTDAVFSIEIGKLNEIRDIDLKKIHHSSLYLNQQFKFSICINYSLEESGGGFINDLLPYKDTLLQLFFHPHFESVSNKPVIFMVSDNRNRIIENEFIPVIEACAKEQGFEGVKFVYLTEKRENEMLVNKLYAYNQKDEFKQWYYQLLTNEYYISDYLGIRNHSKETFQAITELKLSVEENVCRQLPRLYSLVKEYSSFKMKITFLEEKLKYTQEDLENQKTYLEILKSQDEALKINDFYQHEYEILPLWYKKIGHIIKVLIGKRTFRSLYNNNVKKYKE